MIGLYRKGSALRLYQSQTNVKNGGGNLKVVNNIAFDNFAFSEIVANFTV